MMSARVLPTIALVVTTLVTPAIASAQCRLDSECTGDRICEEGRCINTPLDGSHLSTSAKTGWAFYGGGIGWLGGTSALALGVGAAAGLTEEGPGALILGLTALTIGAATGPLAAWGASSSRSDYASGSSTLRTLGWTGYALGMATGVSTLTYVAIAGDDLALAPAIIGAVTAAVLGGAGVIMLGLDAGITDVQAEEEARLKAEAEPSFNLQLTPVLVRSPSTRRLEMGLGFGLTF